MPDRRSPHRARQASPPGQVTRSPATAAGRGRRGNQDAPAGHAALRSNGLPAHTWAICALSAGYRKRFTARGATGTYLRVIVPGEITAGDRIEVIRRPRHTVTIGRTFRALTTEAELLPSLLQAGDDLPPEERAAVLRRTG